MNSHIHADILKTCLSITVIDTVQDVPDTKQNIWTGQIEPSPGLNGAL